MEDVVYAIEREAGNHYSLEVMPQVLCERFVEVGAIACRDKPCRHEEGYDYVVRPICVHIGIAEFLACQRCMMDNDKDDKQAFEYVNVADSFTFHYVSSDSWSDFTVS